MTGLRRYVGTARRHWWLFVLCVIVGIALASAFSLAKKAEYSASVQVLIQSSNNSGTAVADAQLVATSDGFYRQTASALRVRYVDLQSALTVSNPSGTNAIQFVISASTEGEATTRANTVASTFDTYYGAFVTTTQGDTGTVGSRIVSPALRATRSAPSLPRNLAIGFVAGLVIAVLIVGGLEAVDGTVRFPEEIRGLLGLPVTYLPTAKGPARTATVDQLASQIGVNRKERTTRIVGMIAAGNSTRPAMVVATLLADQLVAEDRTAEIVRLRDLQLGDRSGGGTLLVTTNGGAAMTTGATDLPISLWGVVIHLGQATRNDLEQVRLLFGRTSLEEGGIMAIAIPSVDVVFARRRVKRTPAS